ncbi:TPA: phage tail family protein [Streptococcus suis]|nr:phage tail family protein [Streptococcus suis]
MIQTMTFNGIDMSRYFRVIDVKKPIGNDRSISVDDAPSIGVTIQEIKRGPKVHVVKFELRTRSEIEMEQLKHELAGIFNVSDPVKVTYSNEPDKYYLAIPTDDVSPSNIAKWLQHAEITLLIPDGVAHSLTYKEINSPQSETAEKMVFSITNNGTVPAYPIITVRNNAENGYIGLVNAHSALELGNKEEADTESFKRSELLFDYRDNAILSGFSRADKNSAINNDSMQNLNSTLSTVSVWNRYHVELKTRASMVGNNAGSLTWTIPVDSAGETGSLNDYIWWRQVFWLGASNQYGFMKVSVSDTEGNFLYGVETYKRAQGLECEYNFMASNGRGGFNTLKRWKFTGTHHNHHNPFNHTRGWSDLKRNDDKVTVFWWGTYPVFTVPEIKGKKSAKIHVTIGAIGNKPLVSHMYLDSILYRKDFVSVTRDIPNRFMPGSNVTIDNETDTVYIDHIPHNDQIVDGSEWLEIPPGNSQLEVYVSSFVRNKPTVSIKFEERWL